MDERIKDALERAAELAGIAADWNLAEVQLTGGWVASRRLADEFRALAKGEDVKRTPEFETEDDVWND